MNLTTLTILEMLKNETDKRSLMSGDLMVVYDTLKSLEDKARTPGPQATKIQEIKVFYKI